MFTLIYFILSVDSLLYYNYRRMQMRIQAGAHPAPAPFEKSKKWKYVHKEGAATDLVETYLKMSF